VYATMSGRIGILVPFASNEDADFFQSLEMHMRQEHTFLERVYFVLRVDSYSIDRKLNL
jgi:hypothetical protein